MLLYIKNKYPALPLAYSRTLKEIYGDIEILLGLINYNQYKWHVGSDLKIIGILTGLQKGYTKVCCFLCLWDSRDKQHHCSYKEWEKRSEIIPGINSAANQPLINPNNVLLPPLHIKLGLVRNFVKRTLSSAIRSRIEGGNFYRPTSAQVDKIDFIS